MTELLATPELTEDEQLIDDTVRKVVQRFYESEIGVPSSNGKEYLRTKHPDLTDEQIIDLEVEDKLYSKSNDGMERRAPKSVQLSLLQDLLRGVESQYSEPSTKDFALLHEVFESIAKTTDFLQSKEPNDVWFANYLVDRYVAATREFILGNPSGGDLLAADTEESRNAFRVYLAVESAVAGDFETARGMLVDVDGHEEELPLETALLTRLEEAELEGAAKIDKITPETSAANMDDLGLHASEEAIHEVERADPHITIGTTIATLEEMLAPGGRYMTTSEIHIVSSGNAMQESDKSRRGRVNPYYNELRSRTERALSHSTNPFLPKIIYGALTSDLQADRGSGYGKVILHLKPEVTDDPTTTFTYGDSLANTQGHERKVKGRQLSAEDALEAYATRVERGQTDKLARDYIEAHVSGLDFDKIDKISVVVLRPREQGELQPVLDAVKDCIAKGIKTEAIMEVSTWGVYEAVKRRVEKEGMTEDEAVAYTVQRLRSNFDEYENSPLLSLVFVFSDDAELPEGHHAYSGKINRELFAKHGVVIREPKAGRLLEGKGH
jgi:hypothetical protein